MSGIQDLIADPFLLRLIDDGNSASIGIELFEYSTASMVVSLRLKPRKRRADNGQRSGTLGRVDRPRPR